MLLLQQCGKANEANSFFFGKKEKHHVSSSPRSTSRFQGQEQKVPLRKRRVRKKRNLGSHKLKRGERKQREGERAKKSFYERPSQLRSTLFIFPPFFREEGRMRKRRLFPSFSDGGGGGWGVTSSHFLQVGDGPHRLPPLPHLTTVHQCHPPPLQIRKWSISLSPLCSVVQQRLGVRGRPWLFMVGGDTHTPRQLTYEGRWEGGGENKTRVCPELVDWIGRQKVHQSCEVTTLSSLTENRISTRGINVYDIVVLAAVIENTQGGLYDGRPIQ